MKLVKAIELRNVGEAILKTGRVYKTKFILALKRNVAKIQGELKVAMEDETKLKELTEKLQNEVDKKKQELIKKEMEVVKKRLEEMLEEEMEATLSKVKEDDFPDEIPAYASILEEILIENE